MEYTNITSYYGQEDDVQEENYMDSFKFKQGRSSW